MQVAWANTRVKRRIQWLWRPFIQRGTINLLTGGPGTGKSTIACDLAAAFSVGRSLPGEPASAAKERGIVRTLILNAEDDPDDTTIWRLENQGADLKQIALALMAEPVGKEQAEWLGDYIRANNIQFIVIDPIQAWIGQETDMYRPNHMRAWGNQFKNLCALTGVTVLWVRHRRKGDADDHNSINSGLGSIDLSGIVRSEIGAVVTKKGSKITRIKGNVGKTKLEVTYSIKETGEEGNDHGQLAWSGDIEETKAEPKERKANGKGNAVTNWLCGLLISDTKLARKELLESGERLGYSRYLVNKAFDEMAVEENGLVRMRRPSDLHDTSTDKAGN